MMKTKTKRLRNRRLYLFGNGEEGWYKLGVSFDPETRMESFQEWLPFDVHLVESVRFTFLDGFRAFTAEKMIQKTFAAYRRRGEWFYRPNVSEMVHEMRRLGRMLNA